MLLRRLIAACLFALGIAACNNLPPSVDSPALIAEPTPESLEEIREVIEQALGGRSIRLAPNVLTETSILALEQGAETNPAARGRVLDLPERFELVLSGERCFLKRTRTGDRTQLYRTNCVPAR